MQSNEWNFSRAAIPNHAGVKIRVLLHSGEEIITVVEKNEEGWYQLKDCPILTVAAWKYA